MVRRKNLCSSVPSVGDKIIIRGGRNDLSVGKNITDPLYLPLKRGGLVCPYLECPLEVLLIVFLYNYAMNILCIKTGDGYGFYSMLKQAEIDVQSTSNRKLSNFYPSSG